MPVTGWKSVLHRTAGTETGRYIVGRNIFVFVLHGGILQTQEWS